jgi:hypothetical protein
MIWSNKMESITSKKIKDVLHEDETSRHLAVDAFREFLLGPDINILRCKFCEHYEEISCTETGHTFGEDYLCNTLDYSFNYEEYLGMPKDVFDNLLGAKLEL